MPLLSLQNLSIGRMDRTLCSNINLSIHRGEIWGILGPNGAGKTTFLHTLAGLHPATTGVVKLNQQPLARLSIKSIAQQVGVLFQSSNTVFTQTVLEYISTSRFPHLGYFENASVDDITIIREALMVMDLHEYEQRLIEDLSGGEKRRVAIAAVLAQTPNMYLLDEPTNHLDLQYQLRTLQHMQRLATSSNVAVMMTLHDINLAQSFCTHVLLLERNGSMQHGKVCDILSEESLSNLYHVPVRAIPHKNTILWQYTKE